ncbi:hypothetical protein CP968_07450 [Streptomyces subrutilus]|uniref:Uncharacterized protein n=1 Tax=Streptomyces subrutilus TaxID=36818 RepID=A0A5P2UI95_9ACTN|nr:hypothetical protein CP968_07450 [Streptomyces subrutilus]
MVPDARSAIKGTVPARLLSVPSWGRPLPAGDGTGTGTVTGTGTGTATGTGPGWGTVIGAGTGPGWGRSPNGSGQWFGPPR